MMYEIVRVLFIRALEAIVLIPCTSKRPSVEIVTTLFKINYTFHIFFSYNIIFIMLQCEIYKWRFARNRLMQKWRFHSDGSRGRKRYCCVPDSFYNKCTKIIPICENNTAQLISKLFISPKAVLILKFGAFSSFSVGTGVSSRVTLAP